MILISVTLLSFTYWLVKSHYVYKILISPNSFMNKDYICNTLDDSCNIRYFNDKYIFLEKNDRIEIIKFDNFFKKD